MTTQPKKLAYLCSQYPAVSHTFINREIESLCEQGFQIEPISMRPGEVLPGATDFEQKQLAATWCLHRQPLRIKIGSQIGQWLRHPIGYARGLLYALALQRGRPKETLWALFHFLEAAMLARRMRERGLRHVHVHFAGSEAAIALYAHRAFGIDYSFTLHGPDVFYNIDLGRLTEKIQCAAFVICISHFARGQAIRLVGADSLHKLHIVRCGVDPERYRPADAEEGEKLQPFTIVCTGRLTATKGQALLVMACAALRKKEYKFRCVLIGDGNELESLRAKVGELGLANVVELTGALPQDGVYEHLRNADAFVLPSFAEGVPVVLMEAMSMGVPSISTRVGGIAELIEDGVNGFLLHAGDVDGLVDRLEALMDRGEDFAELRKRARETILNHYDVHRNARELGRIFEKSLKPKSQN